ncbi:MAG: hypothetical protein M5U34_41090 [Chloroflexi bacterium]|nr:hypothetical protein [Chloroflexota bacterium]
MDRRTALPGREVCRQYGVTPLVEDITGALRGYGCYQRRDEAVRQFPRIRQQLPAQNQPCPAIFRRQKRSISSAPLSSAQKVMSRAKRLAPTAAKPDCGRHQLKQRSRAAMLYYHAELHDYAVIGTPQRNEHDQASFCEIWRRRYGRKTHRPPVQDTQVLSACRNTCKRQETAPARPHRTLHSAGSTQEEFRFFRLPFETMDLIWYGLDNDIPAEVVAAEMGLTSEQVAPCVRRPD